ncbi:MAG: radical SAM family heme chaperone HemW [Eubacterium sp.]
MNCLGIYIHVPFCVKKCDYCDFLSAPAGNETMERYVKALIKEIELSKEKMTEYLVDTVFIGGGTPSILEGNLITRMLGVLRENVNIADNAEISIECNPGTVTEEKLLLYKEAGINRLSFGLQSTRDKELKSIGRIHSYRQFLDSYDMAIKSGFDNINIDLMSALPGQSEKSYKETLERIIGLHPEHISVYSLIVEDGTKMKDRVERARAKGDNILPGEEVERRMYYMTKALLGRAGYGRYEISNYAKPGFECRHNVGYWKRKEYLGFGIGAASLYKEERYNNVTDIKLYMNQLLEEKGYDNILNNIEENKQKLFIEEQMEEFMFLGLRRMVGISTKEFENKFRKRFGDIYGKVSERLVSQGLLEQNGDFLRLTERGIDISNYVMSEFMF